jgi:hypothetical protein
MTDDEDTAFHPASGAPDVRIAAALEYIAAKIGEINEKLSYMVEYEDDD